MAVIFLSVACRQAAEHLEQCVNSVLSQTHKDWLMHIHVDDAKSDDYLTSRCAVALAARDPRILLSRSDDRQYALKSQLDGIDRLCPHDAIVAKLDGDDYLSDPKVLEVVDIEYKIDKKLDVMWTQFKKTNGQPTANKAIPVDADPVTYGWSSSHLQTFRKRLLAGVRRELFLDPELGTEWRCSCDHALFIPLLCVARKWKYLPRVCYVYRAGASDNQSAIQKATAARIRQHNKDDGGRPIQKNVLFFVNGPGYAAQGNFNQGERRPPMGILSMSAHLRARQHKVVLVDRFMDPFWWPQAATIEAADFIGVYCSTPNALDARWIMQSLRQQGYKGLLAAGGPHAILWPDEVRSWGADLVCQGEADFSISKMVERGMITANDPARHTNLDQLPFPAYDMTIEQGILGKYNLAWPFTKGGGFLSLNTSRGCPYGCAFCDVKTIWGRGYHAQSPSRVLLDVNEVVRIGGKGVYFREDNFCCDKTRLEEICRRLQDTYGQRLPWACEIRADRGCDRQLVQQMAQAGCKGFYVGGESGSDRLLQLMEKGITVQQLADTCKNADHNKISVALSMIDGYPGETDADRQATAAFLKSVRIPHVWRAKYRKTWADYKKEGMSPVQSTLAGLTNLPEELKGEGVKVSVIITCKGRLKQLKQTMVEHLKNKYPYGVEYIIVDYGCPDGTADWVKALNDKRVKCLKILEGTEVFNLSRGRNCGAQVASGNIMVFCDADVYPKDDLWLRTICNQVCEPGTVMTRPHWKRGGCGICAVQTEVFHNIRGFDEAMVGWGYEDIDFRGRMEHVGHVVAYDARMIGVLKHGADNRVQFYPDKNVQASNNRNKRLSATRKGLVNPKGFGICRSEFIRP